MKKIILSLFLSTTVILPLFAAQVPLDCMNVVRIFRECADTGKRFGPESCSAYAWLLSKSYVELAKPSIREEEKFNKDISDLCKEVCREFQVFYEHQNEYIQNCRLIER